MKLQIKVLVDGKEVFTSDLIAVQGEKSVYLTYSNPQRLQLNNYSIRLNNVFAFVKKVEDKRKIVSL